MEPRESIITLGTSFLAIPAAVLRDLSGKEKPLPQRTPRQSAEFAEN